MTRQNDEHEHKTLTVPPGLSEEDRRAAIDEEVGKALAGMPRINAIAQRCKRRGLLPLPQTAHRSASEAGEESAGR